jgi:uncharacterized protein
MIFDRLEPYWWNLTDDNCIDIPLTEVNQVNMLGENPIHIASWRGSPEDVQWLIDNGANLNAVGDLGMTPLHYAYMGGRKDNVNVLLSAGADPNIRCDKGFRPHETQSSACD